MDFMHACDNSGIKSVCVHVAGVAMRLSLLLFYGLAEHLMPELAVIWGSDNPRFSSETIYKDTVSNINTLLSVVRNDVADSKIISDLFEGLKVGTETAKLLPPPPPQSWLLAIKIFGNSRSINTNFTKD